MFDLERNLKTHVRFLPAVTANATNRYLSRVHVTCNIKTLRIYKSHEIEILINCIQLSKHAII